MNCIGFRTVGHPNRASMTSWCSNRVRTRTEIQELRTLHGHDWRCGIDGLNREMANAFDDAVPDDLMEDGQFGIHGTQFGFGARKQRRFCLRCSPSERRHRSFTLRYEAELHSRNVAHALFWAEHTGMCHACTVESVFPMTHALFPHPVSRPHLVFTRRAPCPMRGRPHHRDGRLLFRTVGVDHTPR